MARYAGQLQVSVEGFGLWLFWINFNNFLCLVLTLVTFSSNLGNFEKETQQIKKYKQV